MLQNILALAQRWWTPVHRPPGPTWSLIREEGMKSKEFWSLEFPLKLAEKYGDLIYISLFKQHMVVGPEIFEYILKTNHKNYHRNPFFYLKRMQPLFGKSLLVTEGSYWKHRRKIALPAYQQGAIKNYAALMTNEANALLTKWQTQLPKKINILTEMTLLTLKIALKMFCDRSFENAVLISLGKAIQFCNYYASNTVFLHPLKPTLGNFRFLWYMKRIDGFVLQIIHDRRAHPTETFDLLNLLIAAKNEETNEPLTDADILAEFKTHIVTGHETTTCALSWLWYLLTKNPKVRATLEAELDAVLQGRIPTFEDIPNLSYTKAVVAETFRLYPPIWSVARTNLETDWINGYEIPAGSQVILHLYALHRNPRIWENPNEFCPERFLEPESTRHPYAFLPFNAGSHTCIASHLATAEAILVTATLAQQIRFELPWRTKAIPEPCISLKPKGGIKMIPKRRQKAQPLPT